MKLKIVYELNNDILHLNKKITEAEKKCSISTDELVSAEKKLREALFKEKEALKIAEDLKEKYVRAEVSIETAKDNLIELESHLKKETGHSPKVFQDKYIEQLTNKLSVDTIEKNLDHLIRKRNFVGIDVIGGKLTEINVTSPTGLQELEKFENKNLASIVWDKLISKI